MGLLMVHFKQNKTYLLLLYSHFGRVEWSICYFTSLAPPSLSLSFSLFPSSSFPRQVIPYLALVSGTHCISISSVHKNGPMNQAVRIFLSHLFCDRRSNTTKQHFKCNLMRKMYNNRLLDLLCQSHTIHSDRIIVTVENERKRM